MLWLLAYCSFLPVWPLYCMLTRPSVQPRERDYSYVGSFYAFAIWIGLGVIAIAEFARVNISMQNGRNWVNWDCLLAAPVLNGQ
jgi:hypothetical protein